MAVLEGVNVSNDVAAFRASVDRLKTVEMRRAAAIALNRTADGVQTEAIRMIRATHKIMRRELARGFTIRRAYQGRLEAMVYASGRPLNVIAFGARQTRKGVSIDIKGARKVISHSFIATIPNNNYTGVFVRQGKSRFPIKAVTTVSIPGLFRRDIISNAIANVAIDRFRKELASAIRALELRG